MIPGGGGLLSIAIAGFELGVQAERWVRRSQTPVCSGETCGCFVFSDDVLAFGSRCSDQVTRGVHTLLRTRGDWWTGLV
ncbi:hypothetical protein F2Q68_00003022 [Brassica cretica]|uniref:Reverse transcriptase domain-containing protein n=1 Tax=Brassica cretica TaxID=69181 RepID=A0A8S9JJC0_BRACR|nr:hypothetical protein F2Q68_00003022 [Brassica cretica]